MNLDVLSALQYVTFSPAHFETCACLNLRLEMHSHMIAFVP